MVCIYCGEKTITKNSRGRLGGLTTWRRKECSSCFAVYTTLETVDLSSSIRVQKKKGIEPFIYEKLFVDVYDSLLHRKTAHTDAKELSATILSKLLPIKSGVVSSEEIKHSTLEVLKHFDKPAYIYFGARH